MHSPDKSIHLVKRSFAALLLCASILVAKTWYGAEAITTQTFKYGAFEARIRAAKGGGVITPFFLWKNNSEVPGVPWQEQDFEIFGRDGSFQTQIMTPGKVAGEQRTEHVKMHYPAIPAYSRYNTYRMEWTPDSICFYFNGQQIRKETDKTEFAVEMDPALAEAAQLRVSNWAGNYAWSGLFDTTAVPAHVFVNWIQTYTYTPGSGPNGSNFTPQLRDDFDYTSWNWNRWWLANWTFDAAINDYVSQNAKLVNGALVLTLNRSTDYNWIDTVPADDGKTPGLSEFIIDSTPMPIPGKLNLQQVIADSETTYGNQGNPKCGSFDGRVDFGNVKEGASGECYVSYTAPGEWLDYRIDATAGTYDIEMQAGAQVAGNKIQFLLDGAPIGYTISVPPQGWTTWSSVSVKRVTIPAGRHTLRVLFPNAGLNLRTIGFKLHPNFISLPGRIDATDYTTYYDGTSGNLGGGCQPDNVDKEVTTDMGGGCAIDNTTPSEWVDYPVDVTQTGWYQFIIRASSARTGKTMKVLVDGADVTGPITAPLGTWTTFTDLKPAPVPMAAGHHIVRVFFTDGLINFHYLDVLRSDVALPFPVTGFVATAGDATVSLAWNASEGAVSYKVVRGQDTIATTSTPEYQDNSVVNGATYVYTIVAANGAGDAQASLSVSATPTAPVPPASPDQLTASPGNGNVALTWTLVNSATSYNVYRSLDGVTFTKLASATNNEYLDAAVTNGTSYTYQVTGQRGSSEGQPSPIAIATPIGVPPVMVTGLSATPGDAQVTLTWNASAEATGYMIYRTTNGDPATLLTVTGTSNYVDFAVANGEAYTYTVVASNIWGDASPSAAVTTTPQAYPPVPTSLVAVAGDAKVTLLWIGGTNTTGFNIYRSSTGVARAVIGTSTLAEFVDASVVNGTTYHYDVTALNGSLESTPTAIVQVRPIGPAPTVVTGLVATAGEGIVHLSWNASATATSYKVLRTSESGTATEIGTATTTAFADASVSNGVNYTYSIVASNQWGDAPASASATARPDYATPTAPTSLTAQASDAQVALIWVAGSNNKSFKVYRSTGSSAATVIATVTTASYTDVAVVNGTEYTYSVVGVNGTLESSASNLAAALPWGTLPSQVTGLVATAGNAKVDLSWSTSAKATSYKIVRGTDTLATIATTSYTDATVVNGIVYSYSIVAVNTWGKAPASAVVSAKPSAPTYQLKAQYKAGTVGTTINGIRPLLQIVNTGSISVPLSKVTVRYWFTNDGNQSASYWCDWAQIGSANLTGTVKTVTPSRTGADRYLEIAFKTSAGNLAVGATTGEIQSRFSKSDWSNYTQTNDYSYDATKANSYSDWNRATVYFDGALIWGTEP